MDWLRFHGQALLVYACLCNNGYSFRCGWDTEFVGSIQHGDGELLWLSVYTVAGLICNRSHGDILCLCLNALGHGLAGTHNGLCFRFCFKTFAIGDHDILDSKILRFHEYTVLGSEIQRLDNYKLRLSCQTSSFYGWSGSYRKWLWFHGGAYGLLCWLVCDCDSLWCGLNTGDLLLNNWVDGNIFRVNMSALLSYHSDWL